MADCDTIQQVQTKVKQCKWLAERKLSELF